MATVDDGGWTSIQIVLEGKESIVERWNLRKGEKVNKGDALCILRSGNIQRSIRSQHEGHLEQICISEGGTALPGYV